MAIRFPCPHCGRLLRTASRKIGTEIECPKCNCVQTVPNEEAAALALALGRKSRKSRRKVEFPGTAEDLVGGSNGTGAVRPPPLPENWPAGTRGRLRPHHVVLFVAGLFVAFAVGFLVGRDSVVPGAARKGATAGKERVLLYGTLVYSAGTKGLTGDESAVVVVLPSDRFPQTPWSPYGIRPDDPAPGESQPTIRAIRSLGGAYARTDESGEFSLALPPGRYWVLLLSRHAARPRDAFLDELDKTQIGRYFSDPAELLRTSKYHWIAKDLRVGVDSPVEFNFGRDGRS